MTTPCPSLPARHRPRAAPVQGSVSMKSRAEALRDYVVRRLLLMIPTFLGITFATFLLMPVRARRPDRPAAHDDGRRRRRRRGGRRRRRQRPRAARHPRGAARPAARVLRLRQAAARGLRHLAGRHRAAGSGHLVPLQRTGHAGHRRPAAGVDLLRHHHRALHLRHLHPAGHPEGHPPPHAHRHADLGAHLRRLRRARLRARRRAEQPAGGALGAVSAGRLHVGRRGRAAAGAALARHRLALGAAAGGLPGGLVRGDDHAHEEQPAREHERRLREDGAGQGPELAARASSCTRCAIRSSRWPPRWAGCWASSSPAAS